MKWRHRLEHFVGDRVADVLAWLLQLAGRRAYRYLLRGLRQREPAVLDFTIQVYSPAYEPPDPAERRLIERIFAAYGKARRDQAEADPRFLPTGFWQQVTTAAYSDLVNGLERNDVDRFHFFLANFGAWNENTGISQSAKLRSLSQGRRRRVHFEQRIMARMLGWWQTFESEGRDLSALAIPRFGNQSGALVNGHLIAPYSIFTEVHARLVAGFIEEPRPVLGELGGGFGRMLYFLSRSLPEFTYVGLDLPECLCCASYYLLKTFPDQRFLLYGEGELSEESLKAYDFILFPSFAISRLPDRSLDFFINENSLGMMWAATCRLFVEEICRTSNAFWHRNHEFRRTRFEDGTRSLLNHEYPISREFHRVARYVDVSRFVDLETPPAANDMYWHLYRRAWPAPDGGAHPDRHRRPANEGLA